MARTSRARTSKTRRVVDAPAWADLAGRAGTTGLYGPEDFRDHGPDARMVATLHNVVAQIRKSTQMFLTNGYLSAWSAHLAQALRRLGTPRARELAELHTELVAIARVACVREREPVYESDEHGQFDPVLEALGARLHEIGERVVALDPELRRDVAAHLLGRRPRPSKRPWPRAPRLTAALLDAWG